MMSLNCPCCGTPFLTAAPSRGQTPEAFAAAWRALVAATPVCNCPDCDASYVVVDNGSPGDPVTLTNISKPSVTGVNVPVVPRTGGTALFIRGEALHVGTLQVKIGGVSVSQIDHRTPTSARVITPPASYTLNVAERCVRLVFTPVMGAFSVGESFSSGNGSTGTIRRSVGNQHDVFFSALVSGLADLVGVNVVGTSGAVATITAWAAPRLQPGEMVSGASSAAVAVVRTAAPLVVDAPTGPFVENELVLGAKSGAVVRLAPTAPYSGAVQITVENEYGRRDVGSSLVGALSYT